MKLFFKFTFVIFAVHFSISTHAQPSTSTDITILSQSPKLRSATGWKLNAANWIPNENAISDIQLNDGSRKTAPQNFIWIQLITVKKSEKPYYVFLYEKENYVSDIGDERRVVFFAMDATAYSNFLNTVNAKKTETTQITSNIYGFMSNKGEYTPAHFLKLVNQSITTPLPEEYKLLISTEQPNNKDVVHFRLPEINSVYKNTSFADGYFVATSSDFEKIVLPLVKTPDPDEFDLIKAQSLIHAKNEIEFKPEAIHPVIVQTEDITTLKSDDAIAKTTANDSLSASHIAGLDSAYTPANSRNDSTAYKKPIMSEPLSTLENITGHYFHKNSEKWVTDKSPDYAFETAKAYEIRNYTYKGVNYLLITKCEKYAGSTHTLVKKEDWARILNKNQASGIIELPVIAYSGVGYNQEDMIEIGKNAIDNKPVDENTIIFKEMKMVLHYKAYPNEDVARFFLFLKECARYGSPTAAENCKTIRSMRIKHKDSETLGSDEMFSRMYYETPYNGFIDFVKSPLR